MKTYIAPEMEVSKFNLSDVLTTSGTELTAKTSLDTPLEADNGYSYAY